MAYVHIHILPPLHVFYRYFNTWAYCRAALLGQTPFCCRLWRLWWGLEEAVLSPFKSCLLTSISMLFLALCCWTFDCRLRWSSSGALLVELALQNLCWSTFIRATRQFWSTLMLWAPNFNSNRVSRVRLKCLVLRVNDRSLVLPKKQLRSLGQWLSDSFPLDDPIPFPSPRRFTLRSRPRMPCRPQAPSCEIIWSVAVATNYSSFRKSNSVPSVNGSRKTVPSKLS